MEKIEKIIKYICIVLLILSGISFPILSFGIILGLGESTSQDIVIFAIGYIGIIIFSFISIFRYKFFPLVLISIILVSIGLTLDYINVTNSDQEDCEALRAEPSCIEDECGFNCSNFSGVSLTIEGSICKDKDMGLCNYDKPSHIEIKDKYDCNNDSDCERVSDGCCGCSAGGGDTAINKNFLSEWEEDYKKCDSLICPAVMSDDPSCLNTVPKCIYNKCRLKNIS